MAAQPTFDTMLHQYIAYREAFALGQSVIEYDAAGKAASEMQTFYDELLGMLLEMLSTARRDVPFSAR